jgi:hypothetical protein
MMYRSAIIIVVISLFLGTCGLNFKRGNGNIETTEYEIGNFKKIYVGGNYELKMIPAKACRVVIETDENLFRYINVEHYEETLNINNVHNLKSSRGIFIEVYYSELEQIYSTGTSKIGHEGIIEAEELRINLSGAGAIDLDIDTRSVKIEMSGAGVIILSGSTDIQEAHLSGAGGLMAEKLQSKECDIHLGGIGGANVYVTEKLEASITGIGGIQYSGNPQLIEKQITGLGKIVRNEEFIDREFDQED